MGRSKYSHLSFHYADNKLSISSHGTLGYELTVWPRPMALRFNAAGAKKRIYPEFRVIGYPHRPRKKKSDPQLALFELPPEVGMSKQEAYDRLRNSMPFKYAIALAPFKSHQWNLIALLSMNSRFYDLLKSNPLLAYLLANTIGVRKRIFSKDLLMETLTGMPQAELLKLLGLPATKSVVKLLRKIPAVTVFPGLAWHLAFCAEHTELMKPLGHLKQINQGALLLVSELGPDIGLLEQALLEEVSEDVRHQHCGYAVGVFLRVRGLHFELYPDRAFPRIRSMEALNLLRDELAQEDQRRAALPRGQKRKLKFEPKEPPVPGTSVIQPLITEKDLIEEGQVQNHCVGSAYQELYMTDAYYAYRVLAPERATVGLVKRFGGWEIHELYGAGNKPVGQKTWNAVNAWLADAQPGI